MPVRPWILLLGWLSLCLICREASAAAPQPARPNFLWISAEDISPDLGCYGHAYARTPHLDRFAAEAVRYTQAFSHAGVCAPARSGIITGMYPTSIGTHHMRCNGHLPPEVKCFTEYLRAAGYYCTNNAKQDYQFQAPKSAWDESSNRAHWRNRPAGQPFFAVINFTSTHESQIRNAGSAGTKLRAELRHDPAEAPLPPYYPDLPAVRQDRARYADNITAMDRQVQEVLAQLERDGLADDTIVWFWGDHGRGLPRGKRWIYDSGLHVPLMIRVPEKWRHLASPDDPKAVASGTVSDRLVSFIDFAPTMLSLAGVEIPDHLQGQAFLGPAQAPPREYIYAHRDRMDERYDLIRGVRDGRYKYIRNYMPYLSRGQRIDYMEQMPTMQAMRQAFAEGRLEGPQLQYFEPTKPLEELYDTQTDPHEVHNLADDPQYQDVLARMRQAHQEWSEATGDVGLIPEAEFDRLKTADHWRRDLLASDLLPRLRALKAQDGKGPRAIPHYLAALEDDSPAMRYWGVVGLRFALSAQDEQSAARAAVMARLEDPAAIVRVAAAQAVTDWGKTERAASVLASVLRDGMPNERLLAANALDELGPAAAAARPALEAARNDRHGYVVRVVEATLDRLSAER